MYERSAIVLEKYIGKVLEFNKQFNLKDNYNKYKELITEVENYQIIATKENKIIQEFDETVKKIENIQRHQEKLYKENLKLEEERNKLFYDLDEDINVLEKKFQKIESTIDKNNEQLTILRGDFIKFLSDFGQRQKERNKCEKARRLGEANHIEFIKKSINEFNSIDSNDLLKMKQFINSGKEEYKKEIYEIMTKNGKNEKVAFNENVMKIAIDARIEIADREAQCYMIIYDKTRRILQEIDNDNLKLEKYKKALKDNTVKLAFLSAEKDYIVGFLDYERMTAINGLEVHNTLMEEACKNFKLDMIQIEDLYELILREVANKATKKAYKELYNKSYLKSIEDKEKNFEEEVNSIKINMGTVINSNYWRIEGIKNVYDVFQKEISENFDKDLSEYKIEELGEGTTLSEIMDMELDTDTNKQENDVKDKKLKFPKIGKVAKNKFIDDIFNDMDLSDEEFEDDYDDEEENDTKKIKNKEKKSIVTTEDEEDDDEDEYNYEEEDTKQTEENNDEDDDDDIDKFYDDAAENLIEDEENQDEIEQDYEEDDEDDDDEFWNVEDDDEEETEEDDDMEEDEEIDEYDEDEEDDDYDDDIEEEDLEEDKYDEEDDIEESEEYEDEEETEEDDDEDDDEEFWKDIEEEEKDDEKSFYDHYNSFVGAKNIREENLQELKNKKENKKKNVVTRNGKVLRKSARGRKRKEIKEEERQENRILEKIFNHKKPN